ncbi:DUF6761 family protein [Crocosphaera watsonii WH 8501]|uniref:Uncharacterized protein n=1 Tax=Crocosphaera watsonii WH 8501 TaxID=165597 RepID=Q4BXJ5_CROWT|nr:DUF6761 family protein [Crocosphaera watsonii]EAM48624.1 hypothetical protein CwatDRAFT_1563 [Crocosphaera watsonii WH 8501]
MLQHPLAIRYYQNLTDSMVDLWNRGRRFDEIQCYMDGYLACLRQIDVLEPYLIHHLEEDAVRFLRDPSNFELPALQPETDYY